MLKPRWQLEHEEANRAETNRDETNRAEILSTETNIFETNIAETNTGNQHYWNLVLKEQDFFQQIIFGP